jgi:hypothetical protein
MPFRMFRNILGRLQKLRFLQPALGRVLKKPAFPGVFL